MSTVALHGAPLSAQTWPLWIHGATSAIVAFAFLNLPIALFFRLRRRRDATLAGWLWWFALFLAADGIGHAIRVWSVWSGTHAPVISLEIATIAIGLVTTALTWSLLPHLLARSARPLRAVNESLREELARRQQNETERSQARTMEAVSRLAEGIAHDFNNILQVIEGSLTLIDQQCGDARVTALADGALASLDRGARLTRQLLTFSQVHMPPMEPICVPDLVAQLRSPIARLLPSHILLDWEGADLPFTIMADRTQLELAIMNLVINAREAMPAGGRLKIGFARHHAEGGSDLAEGDYLRITVGDTGIGMTAEVRRRAFEPFFSTKGSNASPGLGLSIVYGVARQSGGATGVTSSPSEGTIVTVDLRLASDDEMRAVAGPAAADDPASGLAGRRILVVDDEEPTRNIVAINLEALGCAVRQAESGAGALALAREEWPDLFLLDYGMDRMNGADLAAALRQQRPDSRILFLTGFADSAAIERAAGPDVIVLNKPVAMAQLTRALERVFALRP